ncbi:hypothetical protein AGABI1DRAFT_122389, partial [Agaricus bisporus var. burnettii JB137-S8]
DPFPERVVEPRQSFVLSPCLIDGGDSERRDPGTSTLGLLPIGTFREPEGDCCRRPWFVSSFVSKLNARLSWS